MSVAAGAMAYRTNNQRESRIQKGVYRPLPSLMETLNERGFSGSQIATIHPTPKNKNSNSVTAVPRNTVSVWRRIPEITA